jgi:type II secretory pathway pseudopilin PulG
MRTTARGITFLETILAVALLGLTTLSVALAINYVSTASIRNSHRMNAAELANRLMLQYFDDPSTLPSESQSIAYGREGEFRYRWSLGEEAVNIDIPPPVAPSAEDDKREQQLASLGRSSTDRFSRFRVVRVRVWLSEETGGRYFPDVSVPQVTIARIYDPADIPNWNPDKLRRQIAAGGAQGGGAAAGLKAILDQMTGAGGGSLRSSISQQDALRQKSPQGGSK